MFKLASQDRVIKVYNYDPIYKEYTGVSDAWVVAHTGLPAYCTLDTPPISQKNQAIVFTDKGWTYTDDHRGLMIFDTISRRSSQICTLGPIPENKTPLAPKSEFDIWDGKSWIKNIDAEKNMHLAQAKQDKRECMNHAAEQISILSFAKESSQATEDELELLSQWYNYRLELNRIDLSNAPDIIWPEKP